jgi:hypothetical protein
MMIKRGPIDKLLQWALNDELPKGAHTMQNVVRIIERAALADKGSDIKFIRPALTVQLSKMTGYYLGGEPHPDALIVAKTLHRFSRRVSLSDKWARRLLGHLVALDSSAVNAARGVRPDVAALMINCAILKRPPILRLEHPRPCQTFRGGDQRRPSVLRLDIDGRLIDADVVHWKYGNARWYGEPRSPLSWDNPSIECVAKERAEYSLWWHALMLLQSQLVGKLKEHEATPLTISPAPWDEPPESAARLPTKQKAAAQAGQRQPMLGLAWLGQANGDGQPRHANRGLRAILSPISGVSPSDLPCREF